VKGVDLRATLSPQRDVKSPPYRLPMGFYEERRSSAATEHGRLSGELHQEGDSERGERSLVERFASLVVGNGEPDVIDDPRYRVWCLLRGPLPRIVAPLSCAAR
jgi:hypothetical protein